MKLTEENKRSIDTRSYESLLEKWRFSPSGEPWFEGETGDYWAKRMAELRSLPGGNSEHVAASKSIGWKARQAMNENERVEEALAFVKGNWIGLNSPNNSTTDIHFLILAAEVRRLREQLEMAQDDARRWNKLRARIERARKKLGLCSKEAKP